MPAHPLRLAAVLVLAGPALARPDAPAGVVKLELKVGESVSLCRTGTLQCPAGAAVCDDPGVVVPADSPEGLALRAVAKGKTLCSAASAGGLGMRRMYEVTVIPADTKRAQGGGGQR